MMVALLLFDLDQGGRASREGISSRSGINVPKWALNLIYFNKLFSAMVIKRNKNKNCKNEGQAINK